MSLWQSQTTESRGGAWLWQRNSAIYWLCVASEPSRWESKDGGGTLVLGFGFLSQNPGYSSVIVVSTAELPERESQ